MTPNEKALRDAWMAELWTVCREWHSSKDARDDAQARNAVLADRYGEASADSEAG